MIPINLLPHREARRKAQPQGVAAAGPRDVQPRVEHRWPGAVALPPQLQIVLMDRDPQRGRLAEGEREAGEIHDAGLIGHGDLHEDGDYDGPPPRLA